MSGASPLARLRGGTRLHLRAVPWRPVDGRTRRRARAMAEPPVHRGPRRTRSTTRPGARAGVGFALRMTPRRASTSSSVGALAAAKESEPSGSRTKTPSTASVWKCTFRFSAPPKRWMTVTVPVRPSGDPMPWLAFGRSRAAHACRPQAPRGRGVIPGESIAKLEGKAQHPLSNRRAREHVVDEMRRTLGHPAAAAARAEASTFAGERNQPIGATVRTPKPGKAMREHAAANESLKLALHEQGSATLVLTSVELPEEGLKVVADDAVEHPMLRGATHVRSGRRLARRCGVQAPRRPCVIKTRAAARDRAFNAF